MRIKTLALAFVLALSLSLTTSAGIMTSPPDTPPDIPPTPTETSEPAPTGSESSQSTDDPTPSDILIEIATGLFISITNLG